MKATALKFVSFDRINEHLQLGWMVMVPNAPMHHHHYGVEMKWICNCPLPGEPTGLRCAHCGLSHTKVGQRYCHACHALYMRSWRARQAIVSCETSVQHRVPDSITTGGANERTEHRP